jgi:hypothetical protein
MEKRNIIFGLFVFATCFLFSQGENMVIVKKGVVTLSSKKIKSGHIEILKNTDTIKVSPASLVFVTNNKKLVELSPNKTYAPKEISKLFVSSKTSFNDDFINLIMNQKYHIDNKVGSTSRGADENWEYLPNDGFKALENTVYLKVNENTNKLSTDIKLYRLGDNDTLFLKVLDLSKGVKLEKPGEYHWKYTAKAGIYDNNFIIPSTDDQKQLKETFDNFKNSISNFTPEMQEQLLQEYLFVNKIF